MGALVPILQSLLTICIVLLPLLLIRQHLAQGCRQTRHSPTAELRHSNKAPRSSSPVLPTGAQAGVLSITEALARICLLHWTRKVKPIKSRVGLSKQQKQHRKQTILFTWRVKKGSQRIIQTSSYKVRHYEKPCNATPVSQLAPQARRTCISLAIVLCQLAVTASLPTKLNMPNTVTLHQSECWPSRDSRI